METVSHISLLETPRRSETALMHGVCGAISDRRAEDRDLSRNWKLFGVTM